jgi:hypothetical protein
MPKQKRQATGGALPLVLLVACLLASPSAADPPQRVLFVGNSYTFYNGGLDVHVRAFVLSGLGVVVEASSVTIGGATLEDHWNSTATMSEIEQGGYDTVILQEQSMRPVVDPESMYAYARLLDGSIAAAGGRTGFFMTWAREADPPMIEDLAYAYNRIGIELDAVVAPVGRAFQIALERDPSIELYAADGSHPSSRGTYLAACVMYATLWKQNPIGLDYINDPAITATEKRLLQTACWDAVELYGGVPGETSGLTLRSDADRLTLEWDAAAGGCNAPGHAVYVGDLDALGGGLYTHDTALTCEQPGGSFELAIGDPLIDGSRYFLVVPLTGAAEGSYGRGSSAGERPVSGAACRDLQNLNPCR